MAKLSTNAKTIERQDGTKEDLTLALDKKRRIDTAFEVYLGLYQAITGPEERQKLYREFSAGFFDLIVIDECHRGSAAEDSAWREILEYFSSATQIGMTATPKETEYVSNTEYFGEPIFTYSLRQGISDGFLAPYKVIKVHIDRDVEGYRPELGQLDRDGNEVEDRIYNAKDFDRTLVLDNRAVLTAKKITEFLKESGDRYQKTIVFCVDQEHAARMRQALVNENPDLVAENQRYVMRITGGDKEGQDQLGNFIDPESKYPVLVTTSRLLSTGVDAQTCRLIVLDREVHSMTEFKQILGRGTRVHEDTKKFFFTLIDFRARPRTSPIRISMAIRCRYTSRAKGIRSRRLTMRRRPETARSRRRRARTKRWSISWGCRCRPVARSARFTLTGSVPASSPSESNISTRMANSSPNPCATSPRPR
jgi:type I restriction enzyme R subunit